MEMTLVKIKATDDSIHYINIDSIVDLKDVRQCTNSSNENIYTRTKTMVYISNQPSFRTNNTVEEIIDNISYECVQQGKSFNIRS
jgi:hypothetical protein